MEDKRSDHSVRPFWGVAATFVVMMLLTTLPTPLYPLYQQRDHFSTFMITMVFAVYGLGVMLALYLVGHVSDWVGRRPVQLASICLEEVACLVFLVRRDLPSLLVARFLTGLAVGAVTATATAHLVELRASARPEEDRGRARMIATSANNLGLALGPLVAGLLADFLPAPMAMPYALELVLLVLGTLALLRVPETVERPDPMPRWQPQSIEVEPDHRRGYLMAALGAAAAFSVTGFVTSLSAHFLQAQLHLDSPLLSGGLVFAMMAASSLSQVVFSGRDVRVRVRWGRAFMVSGMLLVGVTGLTAWLASYALGAMVAGAGVGLVLNGAIDTGMDAAREGRQGAASAGIFLAAYFGMSVPVIVVGLLLQHLGTLPMMGAFALVVLLVVAVATTVQLRSLRH